MPTTTRATPASISASAHGGVRPWCEQGSRVLYTVAPRARATGGPQGHHLGVRTARDRRSRPRNRGDRARRPGTTTAPTHGRGDTRRRAVAATAIALRIRSSSVWPTLGSSWSVGARRIPDRGTHPRSHPDSHRRPRSSTGSAPRHRPWGSRTLTAGWELHPTPRGAAATVRQVVVANNHDRCHMRPLHPSGWRKSCRARTAPARDGWGGARSVSGRWGCRPGGGGRGAARRGRPRGIRSCPCSTPGCSGSTPGPGCRRPPVRAARAGSPSRMASASPGASRSRMIRVPSGVRSRGPKPVPPVVTISPAKPSASSTRASPTVSRPSATTR